MRAVDHQSESIDRRLRVCVIAPSLDLYGGQSIQAARLIEGLNLEMGVEAELLPINPRLPGLLGRLQKIRFARTIVTEIAYLLLLFARLWRYDVVHIFSASYFSFLLGPAPAILLSKLFGKPVLLNYHSGEAEDHLHRWPSAIPMIKLAGRIVVPSGYLVDTFARFGIAAEAISNTVELDRFNFRERRPLRPVILSNRNLEAYYSVADTLRAFALIQEQIPEAKLIVAGDGSKRESLWQLSRELRLRQVEFQGAVPPAQMPALCDSADVFINASVLDNMPLSIIEAFACGMAVATTGAGGIPHIVANGYNGLVVPPGDFAALARAVLSLFDDQEAAQQMIANALACSTHYTWESVKEQWLKVYRELCDADVEQTQVCSTLAD